jgi:hypothetical protein
MVSRPQPTSTDFGSVHSSGDNVGPGFGGDVDLSGFPSEVRGVDAGLNLEFLQSFDGRQKDVRVEIDVSVCDAVESMFWSTVCRGQSRAGG